MQTKNSVSFPLLTKHDFAENDNLRVFLSTNSAKNQF